MDWKIIKDQEGINELLQTFGFFHDGCFREVHLWNSYFVSDSLGMGPGDEKMRCTVLFQRQFNNPSAIEVLFEGIVRMNVVATPENYFGDIFGATLLKNNSIYYWADVEDWNIDNPKSESTTWISAESIKWREKSEWMGNSLRYGTVENK